MVSQKHSSQTGFTLIELLVVIAIITVLAAFAVGSLGSFGDNSSNETTARKVVAALNTAHARTLSAQNGTHYGVHFDTNTVTVFPGDTYSAGHASNTVTTLTRGTITTVSLSDSSDDVVFSRLRGTASATGTVTVTQTKTPLTKTIIIHETGLSEIQ